MNIIISVLILIVLIGLSIRFSRPLISLFQGYKISVVINSILILLLVGFLVQIIRTPIKFEEEKNKRYSIIQQNLIDIRSAELAFKQKHNQFTDNFDVLIPFVKNDSFVIIQKTDSLIEFWNEVYKEFQFKDTMFIDTLGKVSILDSLFHKNINIDSLRYIPFANGQEFQLSAGTISKSKIIVPVFEAKAKKEYFLTGMNKNLIETSAKDLTIGSINEAHLNGNWQ